MNGKENENSGLPNASAITLGLDEYDDIFSDFDPRPFSQRALSEDFLHELKRASLPKEEESGLTLVLLLPKEKRFAGQEQLIKDRLKDHFKRRRKRLQDKLKSERITGFKMTALGVAFMFLATYLLTYTPRNIWSTFIVVLLEPAGWFTFWEGSYLILFQSKEINPDLAFYRKMTGAKINFMSSP